MDERHIMSYEEFSGDHPRLPKIPRYDNFYLIFIASKENPSRNRESLKRLQRERPDFEGRLTKSLTKEVREQGAFRETLRPFDRDLYEAYRMMMGYGCKNSELGIFMES